MLEKLFYILKRLLLSFILLYSFNVISSNFNLIIPINFITLLLVFFLDFPILFSLTLLLVIAF